MAFDPDKFLEKTKDFDSPDFQDSSGTNWGRLSSFTRGFGQGALSNFDDESIGAILALVKKAGGDPATFADLYRKNRDAYRQANAESAEDAPVSDFAGNAIGSIAQFMALGGLPKAIPVAAKAAQVVSSPVGRAAAMGAVSGLGGSSSANASGMAGDAAIGAGLAGATQGAFNLAGRGIKAITQRPDNVMAKAVNYIFGPSEEAALARIKKPSAIRNAKAPLEIADEAAAAITRLRSEASELSDTAVSKLSDLYTGAGTKSKRSLVSYLSKVQNELKAGGRSGAAVGDANVKAIAAIENIKGRIANINEGGLNDRVTEKTLGHIVRELQASADWDDATSGVMNKALMRVSGSLNRGLKKANPGYAEAMKPVAERAAVIEKLGKSLGLIRGEGGAVVPTDSTPSRIMSALDVNKKGSTNALLSDLDRVAKTKILPDAQAAKYAKEFIGGRTNGSRNTLGFSVLGAALGSPGGAGGSGIGAALLGAVGRKIDTSGGQIAGSLIDNYAAIKGASGAILKRTPRVIREIPGYASPFLSPLGFAASRGPLAVSISSYMDDR